MYWEAVPQKIYFAKVDGSTLNLGVNIFPDPVGHFGLLAAIMYFASSAVLRFAGNE